MRRGAVVCGSATGASSPAANGHVWRVEPLSYDGGK